MGYVEFVLTNHPQVLKDEKHLSDISAYFDLTNSAELKAGDSIDGETVFKHVLDWHEDTCLSVGLTVSNESGKITVEVTKPREDEEEFSREFENELAERCNRLGPVLIAWLKEVEATKKYLILSREWVDDAMEEDAFSMRLYLEPMNETLRQLARVTREEEQARLFDLALKKFGIFPPEKA